MIDDGYQQINNIDISETVINNMRDRYSSYKGMTWQSMDASNLKFPEGSFDAVIEKGLLDALFAGTGQAVPSILSEVRRVMRPGGKFIMLSFSAARLTPLEALSSKTQDNRV